MRKKLIVIGAGPKAMAIAAKNTVLAELGFEVPEIHIIEKQEVGANWTGKSGFTNGKLSLGTSPEKDVGFPYQSAQWGAEIDEKVNLRMRDFSWASFLVAKGEYSEWVDRNRPQPKHEKWAEYLQWVGTRVAKRTRTHCGEVVGLQFENDAWKVTYVTKSGERHEITGDGLVVTGPGKIKLHEKLPNHDRLMTVETFWKRYELFRDLPAARVAVVGTGENAAAVAMALAESNNSGLEIDILSPRGMTFSRGESYRENRVYSNEAMGHWNELTVEDKRNFISRTDRGVFSRHAQDVLDNAKHIDVFPGRLVDVAAAEGGGLHLTSEYGGERRTRGYDYVVVATGADQLAFLRGILRAPDEAELTKRTGVKMLTQEELEPKIGAALEVTGMSPRLHLPMMSGIAQGPGFANLSCLGRFSDRVLGAYIG